MLLLLLDSALGKKAIETNWIVLPNCWIHYSNNGWMNNYPPEVKVNFLEVKIFKNFSNFRIVLPNITVCLAVRVGRASPYPAWRKTTITIHPTNNKK